MTSYSDVILCLDFDGVLCDTLLECLVTAYNAYFNCFVRSTDTIDPELTAFFCKYRYLVRPGAEHFVLFAAFDRYGMREISQKRFDELKDCHRQDLPIFHERFYSYRKRLQKDMDYWLALHECYPEAQSFLTDGESRFYIITNKDRESVVHLSRHHGYHQRIIKIFSNEMSTNKKQLFKMLFDSSGIDPALCPVCFVDDNIQNLEGLEGLGITRYLASWGYDPVPENVVFPVINRISDIAT